MDTVNNRTSTPRLPLVEIENAVLVPVGRAPFACTQTSSDQSTSNGNGMHHPFKRCIEDTTPDACKHMCEVDSSCIVAQYITQSRTNTTRGQCMLLKHHPDYRHVMSNTEFVGSDADDEKEMRTQRPIDQQRSYIWYDASRVGIDSSLVDVVFSGVYVYLYSKPDYIGINTLVPTRQPTEENPYPIAYPLIGTTPEHAQPFKLVMRYSNWGVVYKPLSRGMGFSISLPLTTLSLGTFQTTPPTFDIRMVPTEQPIVDEHFIFTCVPVNATEKDTWIRYDDPIYLYHPITQQYVYLDQYNSKLSPEYATVFTLRGTSYSTSTK